MTTPAIIETEFEDLSDERDQMLFVMKEMLMKSQEAIV